MAIHTDTVKGTYGGMQTPCNVFTYRDGEYMWYAIEDSVNVNCCRVSAFEHYSSEAYSATGAIDVELLEDIDTLTASAPITCEEDLQGAVDLL